MQKLSSVLLLNITAPPVPTFDDLLLQVPASCSAAAAGKKEHYKAMLHWFSTWDGQSNCYGLHFAMDKHPQIAMHQQLQKISLVYSTILKI